MVAFYKSTKMLNLSKNYKNFHLNNSFHSILITFAFLNDKTPTNAEVLLFDNYIISTHIRIYARRGDL